MRKKDKMELATLLNSVRAKFRPLEMDKMSIGEWKYLDDCLSRAIVKLEHELGNN